MDLLTMEKLSQEDQDFLAQVEEELKDRYTEKDEEFMKVFNSEPSVPPIMESWYPPSGRRNNFRRNNPYDRSNNRDRGYYRRDDSYRSNRDGGQSNYSDHRRGYNDYEDERHSGYGKRQRY